MFRSIISAFALLALSVPTLAQYPPPMACQGSCQDTLDPALIQRTDGKWFRFATSNKISTYSAPSHNGPWQYDGAVLPNCSVIQLDGRCDLWAADVTYVNGLYYLYYAVSVFGSQTSAIGVATSNTMEVGSWVDHGTVFKSDPSVSPAYNAIDPNLIILGDGTPLLNFGSYWDGIFQTQLNSNLQTPIHPTSLNHLAYNVTWPHYIEGSYMFPWDGHYYLFFSSGLCCGYDQSLPPQGEEYKIMVCRSDKPSGFFVDADGNDCLNSGGTQVLASHDNIYGPGGQGVYNAAGVGPLLYYHYADTNVGLADKQKFIGINALDFSSGWPVVV